MIGVSVQIASVPQLQSCNYVRRKSYFVQGIFPHPYRNFNFVKKTNIEMFTWNMQISILSHHLGVGGKEKNKTITDCPTIYITTNWMDKTGVIYCQKTSFL